MSKIYFIASIIFFVASLFATVFIYMQFNNMVSYWGSGWTGSLWLSPLNRNVSQIRLSKTENLVISNIKNNDGFYEIDFYRGSTVVSTKFIPGKSFVYNIDNGTGAVLTGSVSDLLKPQGGSISVKYHQNLDSTELIIDQIFL